MHAGGTMKGCPISDLDLAVFGDKRKFHTVDGLRGVAALCVACLHYKHMISMSLFQGSYLAVDFFFMLSGFIIAYNYEPKFRSGMRPIAFIRARYIRLFPMYALGSAIMVASVIGVLLLKTAKGWTWPLLIYEAVPAMLFLPGPKSAFSPELFLLNGPAWSLFWEMAVNIVFVCTFRWLTDRVLMAAVLISGVALIGMAFSLGSLDFGPQWGFAYAGALRVCFSFAAGILICRGWRRGMLPSLRLPAMVLLLGLAVCLIVPIRANLRFAYDPICVLIVFPLMIVSALESEPRRKGVYTFFGLISYPLYAIHLPIGKILTILVERFLHRESDYFAPWIGIVLLATVFAASWILARWIDPLLRRSLDHILPGRRRAARVSCLG